MSHASKNYDFVLVIEALYGNPNGDPDNDGAPRTDPETEIGLISPQSTNRKVRDYILNKVIEGELPKKGDHCYDILVQAGELGTPTEDAIEAAYGVRGPANIQKLKKDDKDLGIKLCRVLCDRFWDVRAYGTPCMPLAQAHVQSQIRGAIHLGYGFSVDPVHVQDMTLTRIATANAAENEAKGDTTMGVQHLVPFGIYTQLGTFDAVYAKKNGFDDDDLDLYWEALLHMYDHDASFMRGYVNLVGFHVFEHENASRHVMRPDLYNRVQIAKNPDVDYPRRLEDYSIKVDLDNLPPSVTYIDMLRNY